MNAGLTNLDVLKQLLLPGTMSAESRFDLEIRMLGLGVAAMFETFCNRRLGYLENDTVVFSGDRPHYYLPRYPISAVSKIEMRYFLTDAWNEITGQPINVNYETGLVHFGYTLGRWPLQVRATWSGGYWYETLEPGDEGYPSAQPDGVLAMPDGLVAAFHLQCHHIWDQKDKLGVNLVDKPKQSTVQSLEMSPMVRQMIQPYVRYQLS